MKLDSKERTVLTYVHLQADISVTELAEKTGMRTHSVRYVLDSLLNKKILQPSVVVNKRALGFHTVSSYFSILSEYTERKKAIINSFTKSDFVSWLCPMAGDYEYGLALAVKSFDQLNRFFSDVTSRYGNFFSERTFSVDLAWYYFGKKYLLLPNVELPCITVDEVIPDIQIDDIDKKIINLMLVNPLVSESFICKELSMSSSTVNARILKLKKQKVIAGFIYTLDYQAAHISAYRMIVDCGGANKDTIQKIVSYARQHPHIVSLDTCVGSYDMEMSLEFLDSHSIQGVINHFKETFKTEIRKVRILGRLNDIKSYIVSPLAF